MKTIVLSGKKELDIYINPQRQRLLRLMTIHGEPMTPKQLSVEMGISSSSVQHHLNKLAELDLVEVSRTERIRGITAHYYSAPPRSVSIGSLAADENSDQRLALIQNGVNSVFNGFVRYWNERIEKIRAGQKCGEAPQEDDVRETGDVMQGIVSLSPEEVVELKEKIRSFLQEHDHPASGKEEPWEYALIAYPAKEDKHA